MQSNQPARAPGSLICCSHQEERGEITGKLQNTRLLVVDDHAIVREGLTVLLCAQRGFEIVAEAETAQDGVDQAILFKPDIVLLDVYLRGGDGLCAASKIVRSCPATRVVVFTASAEAVHVRGMVAAGASAYVLKASRLAVLLSGIQAALSDSRFLDPGLSGTLIEELNTFPAVSRRCRDVLTPRETEVLKHIAWGHTNVEIAAALDIEVSTVNTHRFRLCEKLGLTGRAEIVRYGIAVGLMTTPIPPKRPPASVSKLDSLLPLGIAARRR